MSDQEFPQQGYPCPCCNSSLHETKPECFYSCDSGHKFRLQLIGATGFRELVAISGCVECPLGTKFPVTI